MKRLIVYKSYYAFSLLWALGNKVCIIHCNHCNHVNLYDDYIGCVLKKTPQSGGVVVLTAALREEH